MDPASTLGAVSSAFTSTIKVAEKIFEICAVDEEAQAVLSTVEQVSGQLDSARKLRRQKSSAFTPFEKEMFDESFRHSENAIKQVAALAERVRADMVVSKEKEKIRMTSRLLFVLRDSPKVHISLTQLSIASQSLMSAVMLLSSRDARPTSIATTATSPTIQHDLKPPPTYDEAVFLNEGRERNLKKRASMASIGGRPMVSKKFEPPVNIIELPAEPVDYIPYSTPVTPVAGPGSNNMDRVDFLDSAAPSQAREPQPTRQPPPLLNGRARSQRWMESRCW